MVVRCVECGDRGVTSALDGGSRDTTMPMAEEKWMDFTVGAALAAAILRDAKENVLTTVGSIAGFDIRVMQAGDGHAGYLVGENSYKFSVNLSNPTMMFTSMSAVLKNLEKDLEQHRAALDKAGKDIEELTRISRSGFAKADELVQKQTRYDEIMEILNPKQGEQELYDEDDGGNVQYSRKPDSDEGYSTSGAEWAVRNEIVGKNDLAAFYKAVAEIKAGRYNGHRTADGHYWIDRENVIMITDGNYKAPTLEKVIIINTDYGENANKVKELIIRAERGNTTRDGEPHEALDGLFRQGFAVEYTPEVYKSDEGKTGQGEGNYGKRGTGELPRGASLLRYFGVDPDNQASLKSSSLGNWQVLSMAAEGVITDDYTAVERAALDTFREKLDAIHAFARRMVCASY